MKNFNIDEKNFDFETFVKDKETPFSINNNIIVFDYKKYIETLKLINPQKAIEIEKEINTNIQFNKYIEYFTNEIIEKLRKEILNVFDNLKYEIFYDEETINMGIISTLGYNKALHNTLKGTSFENEFFEWYDKLDYYDSDNFDGLIQDKLLIKK